MAISDDAERKAFVLARTVLQTPPMVPEVQLYLASEVMGLWRDTETLSDGMTPGAGELPPPYWAFAWPGGQALARYMLDNRSGFAGQAVLDFGAGSGLVAIAAAKCGAAPVIAAETDGLALAAIELNALANGVFVEPIGNDLIGSNCRWHTVLAGDMCYERPLAQRLLAWLRVMAAEGARVLIGDPGRNYFPEGGVERLATYTIPTSLDLEDRTTRETSVYALNSG